MLRMYLKIAVRSLVKNRVHTIINVVGLSVGITCSLLIFLWVKSERDMDAYHVNGSRLYKVYEREYLDHHVDGNYDTPALMASVLKKVIPEVEYASSMQDENDTQTFSNGKKRIKLSGTYAGDDLFLMFSYPLISGDPKNALSKPGLIAISRRMAAMFYTSPEAAMGKSIRVNDANNYLVSAVFEDLPVNTSRKFEYVISWKSYLAERHLQSINDWLSSGPLTFVMLRGTAKAG